MIDVNWNPSHRELRQFGGIWIVFFSLVAAYLQFKAGYPTAATVVGIAAVTIGGLGLAVPRAIRPVYVTWMFLAFPIGWTISHLLLGAIYYLVMTPVGLLLRAFGNDPMKRRFEPDAKSYWTEHETAEDVSRYFRQY